MLSSLLLLAMSADGPKVRVSVQGDGCLRFERDGRAVFARSATLVVRGGRLVHEKGAPLMPSISVPGEPTAVQISPQGVVNGIYPTGPRPLGSLVLAKFADDIRLIVSGDYLVAADRPQLGAAGQGGFGVIASDAPVVPPQAPNPKPADTSSLATVNVRPATSLAKDRFTLADLADIQGDPALTARLSAIDFGVTPPIGVPRVLDRAVIEARIRQTGVKMETLKTEIPNRVTVTREGQTVTTAQFRDAALKAATEAAGAGADLTEDRPGPDMAAPAGQLQLVVESTAKANDRISVQLGVMVDGRRYNGRMVAFVNRAPIVSLRVGQMVKIRVKANGIAVETSGRVRQIQAGQGQVMVETSTGAILTGVLGKDGVIEVKA